MKKIKIGYFADGPWSHLAFEKLVKMKEVSFQFIVPRWESMDLNLQSYAEKHQIDYLKTPNINSHEFIEKVKLYNCDLFISLSFNQIFKKNLIEIPQLKSINVHAGKLPFYRGRNVLNWALINGEKEFGITVHYIDEGIDTGDIILQNIYPVYLDDDYNTILNKAYQFCAESLESVIRKFLINDINRVKQNSIHPIGFYCGGREVGDEKINWNQTSEQIFNFVRAICQPSGPGAQSLFGNKLVFINKVGLVHDAPAYIGIPGQIIGKKDGNLIVKTFDSFIEIIEYQCEDRLKIGNRLK
jgi:methionyl-tRNA formyltransferase